MTAFRALCAELVDELEDWVAFGDESDCADAHALVDRARSALAQPELTVQDCADMDKHRMSFIDEGSSGLITLDGCFTREELLELAQTVVRVRRDGAWVAVQEGSNG
jgi:hypothetical protein